MQLHSWHHSKLFNVSVLAVFCCVQMTARGEERPNAIVSASELKQILQDASGRNAIDVLDIRSADDYQSGHIEGSKWVDADTWRAKTFAETGLADAGYWTQQTSALGLDSKRPIVIVGTSMTEIARSWWLLRYLGLKNVRLLDGGFAAAKAAELKMVTSSPAVEASNFKVDFQYSLLANINDVKATDGQSKPQIMDNRSQAEFTGSRGIGARAGHIPGAKHFDWKRFLDDDGKFLPAEELKELLKQEGYQLDEPIVAHCQTGGRSAVAFVALDIAGAKDIKNYYLGWSEYANALSEPVQTAEDE